MTDGRDALRRVRLCNDNAREIDKLFPMNVPAHGVGGELAYNFAQRSCFCCFQKTTVKYADATIHFMLDNEKRILNNDAYPVLIGYC